MTGVAHGTFEVEIAPSPNELDGAVSRFGWRKQFHGDLETTSTGIMLSGGDPASGTAGYVAFESMRETLKGRTGGFLRMQLGAIQEGSQ
ncbi:MAG: DUF3224 domain-containing protein [Actinomycetota bacterium]|nr:DUF3224 domain-containing protein [Actinomycetota bacterium]